jgi:hypothetical protein
VSRPLVPAGEESLRDLLGRVIDNLKAYLRAEVALVRATASDKAGKAIPALGLFAVALLLLQATLTVALVALGASLALWLGWPGGLALAAVIGLLATGLLGWIGYRKLMGAFR